MAPKNVPDEKVCFKCGEMKPIGEFYINRGMKDGRLNKCKSCTKKDVSKNYTENREYYAEYERKRFQRPDRKTKTLEYQKTRRENNPEKYQAHSAVSNALRDGRLEKKPCVICGDENSQAHHEDYLKPLDVVWLCRKHHLAIHYKRNYDDAA